MSIPTWRRVIEWFLAVLAAGLCLLGVGLIVREQAPTMNAPGDTWWPLPGLILLEIMLCGLVGLAGVIVQRRPGEPRWNSAPWVAAGALAALGLIGWFGFSVIVFALVPALLFGLAALLAPSRRGEVAVGLGTLVLSAGVNAVAVVGLIARSRTMNAAQIAPTATTATTISRDKSIGIATMACRVPHMVLVGEPRNIRAQLVTLGEADQLTRSSGEYTNYDQPLSTPVWLVQMDGTLQLVGGPPTAPAPPGQTVTATPPQPFEGTCSVLINANTGDWIGVRDKPLVTQP
jgi:hypothetical protein